jgi:hypothetical protein
LGLGGTDSLGRMRWWSGWCRKKSDYSRGQAVPKNGERGEGRRVKQRRLRLKEGRKGLWETRFSKRLKGKWTGSEAIETDRECGLVLGLEDEGVMADVESETDETGRKEEGGRA